MRKAFVLLLLALTVPPHSLLAQQTQKNRLLVLTDIEADPDDTQSLIRLLLYANLIDIEGLVATTSIHMKTRVNPESIERVIRAYGDVQPNLSQHESGFPTAEELLGLVRQGRAEYGMQGVGDGKDSPGSDWTTMAIPTSRTSSMVSIPPLRNKSGPHQAPIRICGILIQT